MTNKPRVALDIDGCLFPWDEAAAEALEEKFGYTDLVRVPQGWDHLREMVSDEHWRWLFTPEGGEATLDKPMLYYPGVPEGLHRIAEVAHVSFITHRPAGAAACTARWIASHGCPFIALHVVGGVDEHLPKSVVKPEAHVYVEDRAHNVNDLLDNTSAIVLMPRLAHNSELHELAMSDGEQGTRAHKLRVYDGFLEAVSWIEGFASSFEGETAEQGIRRDYA